MKRSPLLFRVISVLLCAVLLASSFAQAAPLHSLLSVPALPEAPDIHADYAILIEMKSGTVLYEKNAYDRANPASITKILTALLVIENCSLDETVTFSYRATHELDPESSTIYRTEGEVMTVEECLYALLVASANEVAQGLAEHVSGSIEAFCAKMTLRAFELGAVNSNFSNPHGLTAAAHYTCPYDMALIMQEAMKHEKLREIMGTERYQIPPTNKHDEITYLRMKHPLLTDSENLKYPYAIAGKTGYTDEALNTLVTYAEKDGLDLICVVMHAPGISLTGQDSVALFQYGFQNFICYNLSSAEAVLQNREDRFLSENMLRFEQVAENYCTLPEGMQLADLDSEIVFLDGSQTDDILAARIYYLNGEEIGRCYLKLAEQEEGLTLTPVVRVAPSANERLRQEYLGLPLIYWILIGGGVLLLAIIVLILLAVRRAVKRKRRRQEQDKRAMARMSEESATRGHGF